MKNIGGFMKTNCPLPLMLTLVLFTAANIPAQDAEAKALEGTWVVTAIKTDDLVIDELMMAELEIEFLLIVENNTMVAKNILNGEIEISPVLKIEITDTTIKTDDGVIMPYTLEGDTLTLTSDDGSTLFYKRKL
jgi:hypothetical protein